MVIPSVGKIREDESPSIGTVKYDEKYYQPGLVVDPAGP
jgi:hypothetical protein